MHDESDLSCTGLRMAQQCDYDGGVAYRVHGRPPNLEIDETGSAVRLRLHMGTRSAWTARRWC